MSNVKVGNFNGNANCILQKDMKITFKDIDPKWRKIEETFQAFYNDEVSLFCYLFRFYSLSLSLSLSLEKNHFLNNEAGRRIKMGEKLSKRLDNVWCCCSYKFV